MFDGKTSRRWIRNASKSTLDTLLDDTVDDVIMEALEAGQHEEDDVIMDVLEAGQHEVDDVIIIEPSGWHEEDDEAAEEEELQKSPESRDA